MIRAQALAEAAQRFVYIGRATRAAIKPRSGIIRFRYGQSVTGQRYWPNYRQYLLTQPALLAALPELAGKVLGLVLPSPAMGPSSLSW